MDLLVRATQRRAWAAGQNTSAARPRLAEAGGQREAGGRPELDLALAVRIKAGGRIGRGLWAPGCLLLFAYCFHMKADVTSCSCGSASPAASLAMHLVSLGVRGRVGGEGLG